MTEAQEQDHTTSKLEQQNKELDVKTIWVLTSSFAEDVKSVCYFSTEANAQEHLAISVSNYLKDHHNLPDLKPMKSLSEVTEFVQTHGFDDKPDITYLLYGSQIIPEVLDYTLLPYRIPKPEKSFDFDQFVLLLKEFGQLTRWYDEKGDNVQAMRKNEITVSDIERELVTLRQLRQYQLWAAEAYPLDEDVSSFGVGLAIARAEAIIKECQQQSEQTNQTTPKKQRLT